MVSSQTILILITFLPKCCACPAALLATKKHWRRMGIQGTSADADK